MSGVLGHIWYESANGAREKLVNMQNSCWIFLFIACLCMSRAFDRRKKKNLFNIQQNQIVCLWKWRFMCVMLHVCRTSDLLLATFHACRWSVHAQGLAGDFIFHRNAACSGQHHWVHMESRTFCCEHLARSRCPSAPLYCALARPHYYKLVTQLQMPADVFQANKNML